MAALNGYLFGQPGSLHQMGDPQSQIHGDVFEPELQNHSTIVSEYNPASFFIDAGKVKLTRPPEELKVNQVKRQLQGMDKVGPADEAPGRYQDDFYHRIHLTPSVLKLGNLVSTQTREIEVWNAFFYGVELTDVQTINGDGITVTPPVGTPYDMVALESLVYEVSISTDGPPAIKAEIRYVVDNVVIGSGNYDASITGNRVISLPFAPDWDKPQQETLEWKTDVIKSYSGLEYRAKIRSKPRRGQTYYYSLKDNEAAQLENLLWGWQSRLFAVPLWTETTMYQSDLIVGQTGIPVDTANYAWTVGCLFFVSNGIVYEMQEVAAVEEGQILLKKGLDNNWPRPSVIGPTSLSRIDGDFSVKSKRETSNFLTTTIQLASDPITTDPFIPTGTAPDTYAFDGEEIYLQEPNWKDGLETEFQSEGKVLDFGTSGFAISARSGIPDIIEEYEWLLNGREQMTKFREFLSRREGKLKGFWMPNWKHEFIIQGTTLSGSAGFVATSNFYGLLVAGATGRNHVMIQLKDNTRMIKEINSASTDLSNNTVNIICADTMGYTFEPEDVRIACMVNWYRLNNDKITINYLDRNVATVKTSLVAVQP